MEQLLRATARAEGRHFWFIGFRYFVTPLLEQAARGLPVARLLDCGCGTGANLELLARFGHAFGFDLSSVGLEIGREAGRGRLTRASVTAVPFPNDQFDIVTSFDVLYSLDPPDERAAVAEMYRITRPGGFAIVNVAANDTLRGDHSILSQEVRRYSRAGLRRLLIDAGFQVERLTYTNASLFLLMATTRAFQRRRGLAGDPQAQQQEIRIPPAPVNRLLVSLLRVESWWLRLADSPFGSSLLCLARKPA